MVAVGSEKDFLGRSLIVAGPSDIRDFLGRPIVDPTPDPGDETDFLGRLLHAPNPE